MDVTTIALAVDSTQVNSAAAALDKFAASGGKAESSATLFTTATAAQAKVIGSALAPAAKTGAGAFGAVAAGANAATTAVQQLGAQTQRTALTWREFVGQRMGASMREFASQGVPHKDAHTLAIRQIAEEWKRYKETGVAAQTAVSASLANEAAQVGKTKTAVESLKAAAGAISGAGLRDAATGAAALELATARSAKSQARLTQATLDAAAAQRRLNSLQLTPASVPPERLAAAQAQAQIAHAAVVEANARASAAQAAVSRAAVPNTVITSAAAISASGAAAAKAAGHVDTLGKANKFAAFQSQQLGFQLHDFFVQVASGSNPLTAFVQQGSQLSGTFGGAGNAFRAVMGLLSPMRLLIGGVAGAVGALGLAFVKGQQQSTDFANAIAASGNFAGKTEGQFNALAIAVAKSTGATSASAREFAQSLIRTGEIGPQVFSRATTAAVAYANATGKTADEVAKDFAAMARSPARFAAEANRSLNFITAAQLQTVKAFEDAGRAADAQGLILEALTQKLPRLTDNLGYLQSAWKGVSNFASEAWQAMLGVGRAETVEDRIESLTARLSRAAERRQSAAQPGEGFNSRVLSGDRPGNENALRTELRARQQAQGSAVAAAESAATLARLNKEGADATEFIRGMQARANTTGALTAELNKANLAFARQDALAAKDPAFKATPIAERTAIFKNIIETQTKKAPKAPKARTDNEPNQVRQALLAADLRFLQDAHADERDAVAFQNRSLQALYQDGNTSLSAFFDERERIAADGVQTQLNLLTDEQARLEVELESPLVKADPSAQLRLQDQLADAIRATNRVQVEGDRAAILGTAERKAALKQLADTVSNFRAGLLDAEGDTVGAAAERAKQQIQQARELFAQSQGTQTPIAAGELARQEQAIRNQVLLQQVQIETGRITERLAIEEERIALRVQTGALSENAALQAQGEARRGVVAQLEAQLAAQEAIFASSRNPQLLLNIERTRLELDKLKSALDPLKEKFDNLFKDAGANAIESLLNGTKSLKGAFADFASQITQSINRDIAKEASAAIFGEGGIFGGAGGLFAGVFGGKKAPGAAPGASIPALDTSAVSASLASLQAAGIDPTTAALQALTQAANDAAGSGLGRGAEGGAGLFGSADQAFSADGGGFTLGGGGIGQSGEKSIADLFKAADKASTESARSTGEFGKTAVQATSDIVRLAQAAGQGGGALSLLPRIIQAIAAAASTGTSSAGGGIGSLFTEIAGGKGSSGAFDFIGDTFIKLFGLEAGGYTGNAATDAVAGVVHGKEFVFSAPAVKALGVPALEQMHAAAKGGDTIVPILRGARALGGPVSAGGMYRVNERGPELLQVAGKQYLMPMAQGGEVKPTAPQSQGAQAITFHVAVNVTGAMTKKTAEQTGAEIAHAARRILARGTA